MYAFTSCQIFVKCCLNFSQNVNCQFLRRIVSDDIYSKMFACTIPVVCHLHMFANDWRYESVSLIKLWNCRSDYVKARFSARAIEKRGKREFRLMKKHSRHRGDDTRLFMVGLCWRWIYLSLRIKVSNHFFFRTALCTRSVALSFDAFLESVASQQFLHWQLSLRCLKHFLWINISRFV